MPVVAVNAVADQPVAVQPPAALPPDAPVTVMIHGFRFSPFSARVDPHSEILSPMPRFGKARAISWPRRLGHARGAPGLAVGFGWRANGSLWDAHAEAERAGAALARLIADLRRRGAAPVNIIAHSLGARVALAALPGLAAGDVGRVALLSGAEFRDVALRRLNTPAGRAAEILNVTSRENDLFDVLFERLLGGPWARLGPALGEGLPAPNVVTVQIDHAPHRDALRRLGFPTAPPTRIVCHWSAYTRPGLFPLYRAFLNRPGDLPLSALRAAMPAESAPRWSRILSRGLSLPPLAAH